MADSPPHTGNLLSNLLLFGRLLRECGFEVSSSQMISTVKALEFVDIGCREDFYHSLSCLLVRKQEQIALFDQAFALFWRRPGERRLGLSFPRADNRSQPGKILPPHPELNFKSTVALSQSSENQLEDLTTSTYKTYSQNDVLRHKDFAEMSEDEIAEVVRRIDQVLWMLGFRKSRRKQPGQGAQIDFRHSFRGSLRHYGELLIWSRRKAKLKPRSLVILADISGSMEQYTRMLLHFAYAVTIRSEHSVEVFVFGTRLTRITRQLKNQKVDEAMKSVGTDVPDWSGGTRIGQSLKEFNYLWARRLLTRGPVVLLISDGWDRGNPDLLRGEIARLQRSCHRLIWLNPLLGSPNYQPLTRGMQAALPYIDDFMPVHSLASLEQLTAYLSRIGERRSGRSFPRLADPYPKAAGAEF